MKDIFVDENEQSPGAGANRLPRRRDWTEINRDKNIKKRDTIYLLPLRLSFFPVYPQFHPKTEVRTVFNIVLGKKIPSVLVKKAWRDRWTNRWMGGGHGDSKWANGKLYPSLIRTGTTFCLCTSASSKKQGECCSEKSHFKIWGILFTTTELHNPFFPWLIEGLKAIT